MRLTNSQRDAFVLAVLHDVPRVDYHIQLKTCVQDYLYQLAPAHIQEAYANPATRKYLTLGSVHIYREDVGFNDMYLVPYAEHNNRWGRPEMRIELDKAEEKPALGVIKALVSSMKAQTAEREALQNKLKQTIYSFTTVKSAREAMPEFAKYLPEIEEKTKNLPAISNLVSDLNKAGWPANKKPTV